MLAGVVVTVEIRVAQSKTQLVQPGSRHVSRAVVVQSTRHVYISFLTPRYDGTKRRHTHNTLKKTHEKSGVKVFMCLGELQFKSWL